jgi:hypothetical protein
LDKVALTLCAITGREQMQQNTLSIR